MYHPTDLAHIIRDKYNGDESLVIQEDRDRLASGEPVSYIIGWIPFLGCHIDLSSRPLIPRVETEYWTDLFIKHAQELKGSASVRILDLCAGSGAIGIAVLKHLPNAHVTFSEIEPAHVAQIEQNLIVNAIDASRYTLYTGNLFECLHGIQFDFIVTNPPYVPSTRKLPQSVTLFEPSAALYAGETGSDIIAEILHHAANHLHEHGELWIECDTSNILEVEGIATKEGFAVRIVPDQYARNRVLVAY